MALPSREPCPHGSDPPSGVRRREDAADLGAFAGEVLRDPRKWSRHLRVPEHDAEDLLHDALVLLVEHEAAVAPAARWSWFASTLRHRKLGFARDRARARAHDPALEAHLRAQPPPFPAPDAEIPDRAAAACWLIEQVSPSRRDVARRHLFDLRTLEEIAAETGTPIGTVRSRWERAKRDMRAALAREEAKRGGNAWLVALVALLSGLWVWLTGSRKQPTVAVGAHSEAEAATRQRARTVMLFASAAWVLAAVETHDHWEWPEVGSQDEEVARGFEVERAFVPFLSASAERERDWTTPPQRTQAGSDPGAGKDREMARGLLTIATSAIRRGDVATARDALRTYDFACAANPFAQQRAQLGATLAALDVGSRRGLP